MGQNFGRGHIEFNLIARIRDIAIERVAEIFDDGKTMREIGRKNLRCAQAVGPQEIRSRDEPADICAGQTRNGVVAERAPLLGCRAGGRHRRLSALRLIHQYRLAASVLETNVAPRRRVARHRHAPGAAPTSLVEKCIDLGRAFSGHAPSRRTRWPNVEVR